MAGTRGQPHPRAIEALISFVNPDDETFTFFTSPPPPHRSCWPISLPSSLLTQGQFHTFHTCPLPSQVLLADQPTKQFVDPKDIAALVLHLCGPHSGSFTGACISIDGEG